MPLDPTHSHGSHPHPPGGQDPLKTLPKNTLEKGNEKDSQHWATGSKMSPKGLQKWSPNAFPELPGDSPGSAYGQKWRHVRLTHYLLYFREVGRLWKAPCLHPLGMQSDATIINKNNTGKTNAKSVPKGATSARNGPKRVSKWGPRASEKCSKSSLGPFPMPRCTPRGLRGTPPAQNHQKIIPEVIHIWKQSIQNATPQHNRNSTFFSRDPQYCLWSVQTMDAYAQP